VIPIAKQEVNFFVNFFYIRVKLRVNLSIAADDGISYTKGHNFALVTAFIFLITCHMMSILLNLTRRLNRSE